MKKIILILSILSILSKKSEAGTNASLIFRTNDLVILPTNVWASNAAGIAAAISNQILSTTLVTNNASILNIGNGATPSNLASQVNLNINATNGGQAAIDLNEGGTIEWNFESSSKVFGWASIWNNTTKEDQLRFYTNGNTLLQGPLALTNVADTNGNSHIASITINGNAVLTNGQQSFINVLSAGVTNDGATDNTTILRSLLASGGAFYFPPGRYLSQELQLTNNTWLRGAGATLVYALGATNTNIFVRCMTNTNISIEDMTFDLQQYTCCNNTNFQTYQGTRQLNLSNITYMRTNQEEWMYWCPTTNRHALQINTDGGGIISGDYILGASGVGLLCVGSAPASASFKMQKTVLQGLTIYSNFVDLFASGTISTVTTPGAFTNWITDRYVPGAQNPEYETYSDLSLESAAVGMTFGAGNMVMTGGHISDCLIGQLDCYGNNPHHGSINHVLYNHNPGIAIFVNNSVNSGGEIWNGCRFDGYNPPGGPAIIWDSVNDFTMENCEFSTINLTNYLGGTGYNFFHDNTYYSTWASQNVFDAGGLFPYNNFSYSVVGDSDGSILSLIQMQQPVTFNDLTAANDVTDTALLLGVVGGGYGFQVIAGSGNTNATLDQYGNLILNGQDGPPGGNLVITNGGNITIYNGGGITIGGETNNGNLSVIGGISAATGIFSVDPIAGSVLAGDIAGGTVTANNYFNGIGSHITGIPITALTSATVFTNAQGFASQATNTASMAATGYTNTTAGDLDIVGLTGTSITYSNAFSHTTMTLGTITSPTYFHLKTKCALTGTSMTAALIEGH